MPSVVLEGRPHRQPRPDTGKARLLVTRIVDVPSSTMGKVHDEIGADLRTFIGAQQLFFVATAPLDANGHVNVSPKGLDSLRILGPKAVAYLDYVGSGVETLAHVRENRRIVLMFCSFEGPPKILRLHGLGTALEPQDSEYQKLRSRFPPTPQDRAIIVVAVERISDSCGFGVPLYRFEGQRSQLVDWVERKGPEGLVAYQTEKNARSIDQLPALDWVRAANRSPA